MPVVTYNGVIADNGSGSGRLVKTGGGVLALGGASTFTGGTLIRSGTVRLTNPLGLGSTGTVTIATAGMTRPGFPSRPPSWSSPPAPSPARSW